MYVQTAHKKMIPDEERMIEVRTDLPRTEWKVQAASANTEASTVSSKPLPKRAPFQTKGQHNLLGRKAAGGSRKGKSGGGTGGGKKK